MRLTAFLGVLLMLALGACAKEAELPAPPRSTSEPEFESHSSTLVVPITVSLNDLQRELEHETPRKLWSIDRPGMKCVPAQRVRVLGRDVKVTPDIECRVVGEVTRGALRLTGSGKRLRIEMPIEATVAARDIGGVLKGETATASATVRADVTLGVDRNWNPSAKVRIAYDWREPPGIDFLGQRIGFAKRADRELAGVIAGLERQVQRQIARTRIRPIVAEAWQQGFTVIELSARNPQAWMRVTPQAVGLSGYAVTGRTLTLTVALQALTETVIGDRPSTPKPTRLPPQVPPARDTGLRFFMPVTADYTELEPVVLRALRRLAEKGIRVEGVGHVNARFDKVEIYATEGDRLAVGIDAAVEPVGERTGMSLGTSTGRVWLTGRPVSEANSQVVSVTDLDIYGDTDGVTGDLLIRVAQSESVRAEIARSLTEDFTRDYERVLDKARAAIAARQEGAFHLSAEIDSVEHAQVQVTGAGLFMPAVASGRGSVRVDARRLVR